MIIKERPILFNAQMVRATLDGIKTHTRRVMKYQICAPGKLHIARPGYCDIVTFEGVHLPGWQCPYGKPGDRLWVRETWMPAPSSDDDAWDGATLSYQEWDGCGKPMRDYPDALKTVGNVIHRASWNGDEMVGWKPSIFMPRWASRITLEITDIRVERLQDITRGDCMNEGCPFPNLNLANNKTDPIAWFSSLWQSINGAGSWQANPWVWVIEFKRVEQ